ncbi:hypothetical protein DSECCO2_563620 [anaerobic digester metagenome]
MRCDQGILLRRGEAGIPDIEPVGTGCLTRDRYDERMAADHALFAGDDREGLAGYRDNRAHCPVSIDPASRDHLPRVCRFCVDRVDDGIFDLGCAQGCVGRANQAGHPGDVGGGHRGSGHICITCGDRFDTPDADLIDENTVLLN